MNEKKNSLWDIKKMTEHALKTYPHIKELIDQEKMDVENIEHSIGRYIRKFFYPQDNKQDKNNEKDETSKNVSTSENDEKPFTTKHKLHPRLAQLLIEDIMKGYFLKSRVNLEEKALARQNALYEESMCKLKKQSERDDEKLNQEMMDQQGQYCLGEYDDEASWSAELPEGYTYDDETGWVSDGPYHYENTPDLSNIRPYNYHIPIEPYYSNEFADKVIDRIMIRAIFDYLYEFKEEEFRRDLEARSKLIDKTEPLQVRPGFSKLTKKLENPFKHYISLKDTQKKRKQ